MSIAAIHIVIAHHIGPVRRSVTGRRRPFANATIVHIDIEPAEIEERSGDVAVIARSAGVGALTASTVTVRGRVVGTHSYLGEHDRRRCIPSSKRGTDLSPHELLPRFAWHSPTATTFRVVTDVGQHTMWRRIAPLASSSSQLTSGGAGTMGFAVPAALVPRSLPKRDHLVMVATAAQMTNQNWPRSRKSDWEIKIAILNNGYLGMVRQCRSSTGQRYARRD